MSKGVDQNPMKRLIMMTVLKMIAEALLFTTVIGVVIGVIGYLRQWDTSLAYSNAFFLTGALVIIAGVFARQGAGKDWRIFQLLSAESFKGMSSGERAEFIINTSSPVHNLILSVLIGILLIVISLLVVKIA